MHAYEVGRLYHPDRKVWPQGSQFVFRGGELELVLFFDNPSRHEVEAVRTGRSDFALYDHDDLVVLCYRFEGPKANVPWSDSPYCWHLVAAAERILPPDPATLTPESRTLLHVVLVNAVGGQIQALHSLTLSPDFTRALFSAITRQAARPFDRAAYDLTIDALYRRYQSSAELAATCTVRCRGGD